MTEDSVVWLEEVGKEDIAIVGGKGASLGEMLRAELPVLGGFAVTAQAFRRRMTENGVSNELFKVLEVDFSDADVLKKTKKNPINYAKEKVIKLWLCGQMTWQPPMQTSKGWCYDC